MPITPLRSIYAALILCTTFATVSAKSGRLDSSFHSTGFTITDFTGTDDVCNSAALAPDGRIILVGETNVTGAWPLGAIARYKQDGSTDSSFGNTGRVVISAGNSITRFNAVAIRPDGRILAVGEKNTNGSSSNWDIVVIQLKTDGSPDSSFGVHGIFTQPFGSYYEYGTSIALQADGKIVIGATANFYGGHDMPMIVRLTASGGIDNSFGNRNGFVLISDPAFTISSCSAVALGTDGRITMTGAAHVSSSIRNILYRFLPGGALDPAFGNGGQKLYDLGSALEGGVDLKLLPGNRPLVMGYHVDNPPITTLARFDGTDGTGDSTFGRPRGFTKSTTPAIFFATKLLVHPYGSYMTAGYIVDSNGPSYSAGIFAVDSLGDWDSGWATDGLLRLRIGATATSTVASAILSQPDGKIIVAGSTKLNGKQDFWVARLEGPDKRSLSVESRIAAPSPRLSVYPNPVRSGSLSVSCNFNSGSPLFVSLTNVAGILLTPRQKKLPVAGTQGFDYTIPGNLPAGTYILHATDGQHSASVAVSKE